MPPNPPLDPKASLWNLIAVYLRFQREHRGLSGESLGRTIGASKATVSKIENGKDRLSVGHAKLLDTAWETGNPELLEGGLFEWLIFFASLGHRPQWGQEYARFEQASRIIRIFEPSRMTGLFQTADYARALLTKAGVADPEPDVAERMARKAIMDRAFVTVTLSEAALRWPVGSPAIMREQLAHVLELADRVNVVVHVIPATFETGAYLGLDGSLKLLTGDNFGDLAYTETLGSGRLVSAPTEVAEFVIKYARIVGEAVSQTQSQGLIRKIMEEEFPSDDNVAEE